MFPCIVVVEFLVKAIQVVIRNGKASLLRENSSVMESRALFDHGDLNEKGANHEIRISVTVIASDAYRKSLVLQYFGRKKRAASDQ